MFFTLDDYKNIERWLSKRTVKDTDFPLADPLHGTEGIPVIQDGKNKILGINSFIEQVKRLDLPDFYNITDSSGEDNITIKRAVELIPVNVRKLGLAITFRNENGNWVVYQFKGTSVFQWDNLSYWSNIVQEALDDLSFAPDEEDLTRVRVRGKNLIKFKDKEYRPEDFSGMGRIILRKNMVCPESLHIDDEDHFVNLLTQQMVRNHNTVYIVQYDFDLDGGALVMPINSVLWFQGGSINNGTLKLTDTPLIGVSSLEDIGTVRTLGDFSTGQIMVFTEEETDRKILKWWNGDEWIQFLGSTELEELRKDLTELIEAEKERAEEEEKNLTSSITNISNQYNRHETEITNINKSIENLKTEVEGNSGISKVKVNGKEYLPDDNKMVTLPDYPTGGLGDTIIENPGIIEDLNKHIPKNTILTSITLSPSKYTFNMDKIIKFQENSVSKNVYPNIENPENNFFKSVVKSESPYDECIALGPNGEYVNLYKEGFDFDSLEEEAEVGIIYSDNIERLNNITIDIFNNIKVNTREFGKISFEKYRINACGTYDYTLNQNLLSITLDRRNTYYRAYINVPSKNIFLTTYKISNYSGKLYKFFDGGLEHYMLIDLGIGFTQIDKPRRIKYISGEAIRHTANDGVYNTSVSVIVELENLYVTDSSFAISDYVSSLADPHIFNTYNSRYYFETPVFTKLSNNRYKISWNSRSLVNDNDFFPVSDFGLCLHTAPDSDKPINANTFIATLDETIRIPIQDK